MNCGKCGADAQVVDVGSASGRKTFRCPKCGVQWREKAPEKNPAAVALGSLGGRARAENMNPEARSAQATEAATARWTKEKSEPILPGGRGMFGGKTFSR